jgi:hypothetical protein
MKTIDNVRNDILNNRYDEYKKKIIKIKENNNNINIPENKVNELAANTQKLGYIISLINYSVNAKCINQKGFLKKITNEINNTTKLNFSTLDTYKLMNEAIKKRKEYNKILKKKEFSNNMINMKGGFMAGYFGWDEETGMTTKALDISSFMLDIAGIIPAAGIAIDGLNLIINVLRQKWIIAGISLISMVPVIGTIGPALKLGYNLMREKEVPSESESESEAYEEEYEEEYE